MSRSWKIVLGLALLLSVAVEFVLPRGEAERLWEHRTFFAWYGFAACVAIILISKALGKYVLQKPEDYYEGGREDVG